MKKKLLACMLSATIVACQSGLFVGADYMPKAKHKRVLFPSYKWLNDKIGHNKPVVMAYGIKTKSLTIGHAITILGTYKAKKKSSGKTYSYLMVYDGYNNVPKYINYTTVDFSLGCNAVYFDIRAEAWR